MLASDADDIRRELADADRAVLWAAETVAHNRRQGRLAVEDLDALEHANTRRNDLRRHYLTL